MSSPQAGDAPGVQRHGGAPGHRQHQRPQPLQPLQLRLPVRRLPHGPQRGHLRCTLQHGAGSGELPVRCVFVVNVENKHLRCFIKHTLAIHSLSWSSVVTVTMTTSLIFYNYFYVCLSLGHLRDGYKHISLCPNHVRVCLAAHHPFHGPTVFSRSPADRQLQYQCYRLNCTSEFVSLSSSGAVPAPLVATASS